MIPKKRSILYLALLIGAAGALTFRHYDDERANKRPSIEASRPDWYMSAVSHIEALGDSITYGDRFEFEVDPDGLPRKTNTSFQGWPELLAHMLTRATGVSTAVWNMGYPGDRANRSVRDRLPVLLKLNTGSDRALLLVGTNDSNDFNPTSSGKGCTGNACLQTYKGEVLSVIDALKTAGRKTIYLGRITPAWGAGLDEMYSDPVEALTATRNIRIREYNQVIVDELARLPGVELGPDLYSCFLSPTLNRLSLFKDALHPNTLGYTFMAALWFDTIVNRHTDVTADHCKSPIYILESLDSFAHGHKQNLLTVGDKYYVDESFTITNIPTELTNGIWVTPANADKKNRDSDYLLFDAGQIPVTVYIAYDPAGSPPVSSSHQFSTVHLSSQLMVSDESVIAFSIARASGVTGTVRLGGTRSASMSADQQAYLVVVVP